MRCYIHCGVFIVPPTIRLVFSSSEKLSDASRTMAMSNPSKVQQGHIILHTIPAAWGHNKPLCALALRILEAQSEVVVTYLTGAAAYSKVIKELKRWPNSSRYLAVESRLNVIDITGPDEGPLVAMELKSFALAFAALYSSLFVTCLTSGKTITGLPVPTFAIIDPYTGYAFEAIRTVAGTRVPILAWFSSNAGSLLRACGPPHLGGVADPEVETLEGRAKLKKQIKAGEPIKWYEVTGSTVNIPGIPPSYDYEWFPSALTALADLSAIVEKACGIYIREADGIVCVSAAVFEPEAMGVAKEWFRSMGKSWYNVGPLSVHVPEVNGAQVTAGGDTLVGTFLSRIQSEFGPKSMLYISFGTVFWPEESDRIWAVIDGLIRKRQPFLFSHPSPFQQFPDDLKRKISDSGIAMEVAWAPQELVLAHPATGWFLTHGGWNSTQEALFYRVPLIFWPIQADQPYNAMRISSQKAGFQLIEVRTGKRKPYNCRNTEVPAFTPTSAQAEIEQIIDKIRGEEGLVVRKNFEAIGDAMDRMWDSPEGESRKDLELMLESLL